MDEAFTYPAMLRIKGQKCIVIGGGSVAARKAAALSASGADVTVVAPEFCARMQELVHTKSLRALQKCYSREQLDGALIVVAATNDPDVNAQITRDAPALVNNVTDPASGNFSVPASHRDGSITLAVATSGFPMLSRRLRDDIAGRLPPELAELDAYLLTARARVRALLATPEERSAFWRRYLPKNIMDELRLEHGKKLMKAIDEAITNLEK